MRKILSLIIMLAISFSIINAQKIVKNGKDPFTGNYSVETSEENLLGINKWKNQWNYVKVALRYEDGNWTIPASLLMDNTQKFNEECELVIILSDGRIITLHPNSKGEAINSERGGLGAAKPGKTDVYPFKTIFLGLTQEDIDAMSISPVTNIRVTSEMTHFDYDIKGKDAEVFIRMIQLIKPKLKN